MRNFGGTNPIATKRAKSIVAASAAINGKLSEFNARVGLAELDDWEEKRRCLRRVRRARYRPELWRCSTAPMAPPLNARRAARREDRITTKPAIDCSKVNA